MPSPRRKSIQHGAHSFTIISLVWTLFSAFGLFDWFGYHRTISDPNAIPDLIIWSLHILFIGLAIHLFRTEKKREVLWLGEDDEIMLPTPQEANIPYVRAQLGGEIKRNLKALPRALSPFVVFALLTHLLIPKLSLNDTLIFLGLVLLFFLFQTVGGTLYDYFAIVSRNREFQRQQRNSP